MGTFDDLTPQQGGSFADLVPTKEQKKAKSRNIGEWIADTFGPNGNLRGSEIGSWMQGMADPVVGGVQLLANALGRGDSINQEVARKEKELEAARASFGRDGTDVSRIAGNVASPVNLVAAAKVPLAASTMGRIGQGAALGAAGAALEPVFDTSGGYWNKKAAQAGAGATAGAVLTPALAKGGEVIARKFAKSADSAIDGARASMQADDVMNKALAEIGQSVNDLPPNQLQSQRFQVVQALKEGKQLDPAAVLRKADFDELGIKPLLGQITRNPTQYALEMNLRGTEAGIPIMQRMTEQQQALQKGIGKLADGAGERYQAGRKLIDDLAATDDFFSKHVSGLYKQARESAGKDLDVPLQGLAQDYARILRDFGDKLPSGVRNNLDDLGLLSGNQTKVFTVEDADRLLKVINSNTSNDPAVNAALSQIRGSVKNAVNAVDDSGGVFAPAVKAAKERFQLHEAIPAFEAAAKGSVSPDDFVRRFVVGGKTDDVQGLSKVLGQDARQEARAQIGDYLRRAAFGENTTGDKAFSQERFNRALTELGSDKLKAFFSGAEIDMIKRMGRVGAYMTSAPAGAPVNSSNTASTLFNFLQHVPYLGRGVSAAKAVGGSVVAPIRNNAAVRASLNAAPPVTAAPLTEPQRNMLARLLAGGAAISGGLAAPGM